LLGKIWDRYAVIGNSFVELTLKEKKYLFALFVGRSGHGKSAAACSFDVPYLEMDFDLRSEGIVDWARKGFVDGSQIEVQQFPPQNGWGPVDKFLENLRNQITSGQFKFKTIGIGSLTNMTRLFVITSHGLQKGKSIGTLRVSGPGDYMFEATATHQVFDYLRVFPCNVICTAHIIDKWGKNPQKDQYAGAEVIGEKLSIRDNLGENVQTYFDNVFRFSKEVNGHEVRYFVEFTTDLAKNSYGLPPGKFDITNKNFKDEFNRLCELAAKGELEAPKAKEFSLF